MRKPAKIFQAISDINRIRILKMLEVRPLCVCEITEVLQLATSTVSKHLSILRDVGFIIDQKEGKWVNYYLNPQYENDYVRQLIPLIKTWLKDDEQVRLDVEKVKTVDRNILCAG